jgi:hypothetical protein
MVDASAQGDVQKQVQKLLALLEQQITPIISDRAIATITVHLGKDKPPVVEVNRKWPLEAEK